MAGKRRTAGSARAGRDAQAGDMKPGLREAFAAELEAARLALRGEQHDLAFRHLERAHILGQRHTRAHVTVHWLMLRAGMRRSDVREVVGQMARIAAALLFSRIWVPLGNTGGANVSAFRPMPVPEDLRQWIEDRPG